MQVPILTRNDALEPRVHPTATPTHARENFPANTPKTPTLISTKYKDMLAKKIIDHLKHNNTQSQDPYAKTQRLANRIPSQHQHFTWSKIQGFSRKVSFKRVTMHTCNIYKIMYFMEKTGSRQTIDHLIAGPNSNTWTRSLSNELGRLAQGGGKAHPTNEYVTGTNSIFLIPRYQVPNTLKVTYINMIFDLRPLKKGTH